MLRIIGGDKGRIDTSCPGCSKGQVFKYKARVIDGTADIFISCDTCLWRMILLSGRPEEVERSLKARLASAVRAVRGGPPRVP